MRPPCTGLRLWWHLPLPRARKDREHLIYHRSAPVGGEVPGVDGLSHALKPAELGLLAEVPVYDADDGVDRLAREPVTAAEQLAPHLVTSS